uniref:Uncharacterized protein n=2 Tax=Meloidogyne TaxID=189290 RepID=A0A915M9J8_MELJA
MQNLNLLIIFIKFSFVVGMYHRHGALENIPPQLPNNPIVFQLLAIEGLDETVKEKLVKAANHNIDPALLNPFNTASHNILDQNNKYLAALTYLNNKLSQIQHNIIKHENMDVGTALTLSNNLTEYSYEEK